VGSIRPPIFFERTQVYLLFYLDKKNKSRRINRIHVAIPNGMS